MKRITASLLALWVFQLFAISDPLPVDQSVKIGKLENGLTYYIQENGYPKGRASLRLIVKTGSLYEEDHQRGLAHFLEHMVFRGSKHFQDWEMINYLESIGAKFGPDTNAFTGFEQTCYLLEIPLDKEEVLDRGILILSDFAGRATLDGAMIDKEREVIMDEYNISTKNPMARVLTKYLDHFFHGSRYLERLPIGKKEIIRSCDPEVLREFYQKWYRTDRMAVIAVGDFDANVVESYIKEHFSDLEAKTGTVTEPELHFTASDRGFFIVEEPEFSANIGGFALVEEVGESGHVTKKVIKNELVSRLFHTTLDARLNRSSKKNPSPFLSAMTSSSDISSLHRIEELLFYCFEDRPLDGLKAFYEEISVLKQFGATEEEWKTAIEKIKEEIEHRKANLDRIEHASLASRSAYHFLENAEHISVSDLLTAKEEVLATLIPEDMVSWADKNVDMAEYHAVYITPKKDLITPEKIEECLKALETQEWVKPVSEKRQEFEVKADSMCVCKMPLVLHHTELEKQEVIVQLIANKGFASFPEEWLPSVVFGTSYLMESGFANLNGVTLAETLQAKDLSFNISMNGNARVVTISGKPEHEELMFQLIHALFLEKRFCQDAWTNLLEKHKEFERNRDNNPYRIFSTQVEKIIHSSHPFFMPLSANDAKEEFARKAMEIAFNDPQEFTLIAVGDFDEERWRCLADCYLNFSATGEKMAPATLPLGTFPKDGGDEIIRQGKESHCFNVLAYQGSLKGTAPAFDALEHLLQHRLLERLRQDYGDTYGVRIFSSVPFIPNLEEVYLYIFFTTEPDKAEKLKSAAEEVIRTFVNEGPTADEIARERELQRAAKKKALQSNEEWVDLLVSHVFFKTPIEDLVSEERIDQEITAASLQQLAKDLFAGKPCVKITLLPEGQ